MKYTAVILSAVATLFLQSIPHSAQAEEDAYLALRGGYGWSEDVARK